MALPIKIKLPDGFLDPEVRCGYNVSEKLKKIWAVELDLLVELLRVCEKHNITIQIFGGTLLGAIRHRGFIPWDDDLDVCISRVEFKKLCQVAPAEFKEPYFLQTALSDRRYFLSYARLRNSYTTAAVTGQDTSDYNNGIYIDIYVLEGYPSTNLGFMIQDLFLTLTVKPVTLYYQDKPRNKSIKEHALRMLRPFIRLLPYRFWLSLYYLVLRALTPVKCRIGLRHEMSLQARRYWMFKNEIGQSITMPFEFLSVPVPKSYADILGRLYGDYLSFPPVEQRGVWHNGKIRFNPDMPYKELLRRENAAHLTV